MVYVSKDELLTQLHQPLLMDDQVTEAELLNFIKGYLVYLLNDHNKTINYAFLVNSKEILVREGTSQRASKARIQNFMTESLTDYQFKIIDDDRNFLIKRAKVSDSAQNFFYLEVKKH